MSLARFFPRSRESAEEIKRRMWQYERIAIVRVDDDLMPWDLREMLTQWADRTYGQNRRKDTSRP